MSAEKCVICESPAQTHHDERKHHHVQCPQCGSYIVADTFAPAFIKMDSQLRSAFAAWMSKGKENSKRFLYKTRPNKTNPYSAKDGFEMISLGWIHNEFGKPKDAPQDSIYRSSDY
jgi:hypothetical protein